VVSRVSVKERLGILENIEPTYESGLLQLSDGTLIWSVEKEMCRLVYNLPAKTVRKANAMQHYSMRRCLTIQEYALAQSFPVGYRLAGRLSEKRDQIGNAIPVELARALARSIMASLKINESKVTNLLLTNMTRESKRFIFVAYSTIQEVEHISSFPIKQLGVG
jgi:site-specific DNA-cytosine methylase